MSLELFISGFAIILSVFSLVFSVWSTKRQEYLNSLANNLIYMSDIERTIADTPSILELHSVEQKELEEAGVTPQEFAYLLSSFSVGGLYYRTLGAKVRKPFAPGTYRYNMLKSERTRRAWPLIKKFMGPSPYRDKIEFTISCIDRQEKLSKSQ